VIPFSDFHANGTLWGRRGGGRTTHHYKPFDWSRVNDIRFHVGDTPMKEWVIYLDELMIVPRHNSTEAANLKKKARASRYASAGDGQGDLVLFDDKPNASYFGAHPPPYTRLVLDESVAKVGKKSFQYVLDTKKRSWCSFGIDNLDFAPYVKSGSLEFWIKGEKGGEEFNFGFQCTDKSGITVSVGVKSITYLYPKTRWQKVTVPLTDFPAIGKDTKHRKRKFDWSSIHQFYVEGLPRQKSNNSFWLDDIKVIKRK
jgi:hypothetical protein